MVFVAGSPLGEGDKPSDAEPQFVSMLYAIF